MARRAALRLRDLLGADRRRLFRAHQANGDHRRDRGLGAGFRVSQYVLTAPTVSHEDDTGVALFAQPPDPEVNLAQIIVESMTVRRLALHALEPAGNPQRKVGADDRVAQ